MLFELLDKAIVYEATDLHVEMGEQPRVRGPNGLEMLQDYVVNRNLFSAIYEQCGGGPDLVDGAFSYKHIRVRVHLFSAGGKQCGTLRLLYSRELLLGDDEDGNVLRQLACLSDGLVIISGPTCSGKSYTLAGCIQYINQQARKHIVTLEDPVEFVFANDKSLIHQRQLGQDVTSMAEGVREALREDPDVIMIGEMRDRATLEAALHAAETGHLVFATLHTQRAVMAINRIISMFPAEQQDEVRSQLSQVLRAVICQRLVRLEKQFVTVRDVLLNNAAVSNLIRQRKEPQIVSIQETQRPMRTLEMAVALAERRWGPRKEFKSLIEA